MKVLDLTVVGRNPKMWVEDDGRYFLMKTNDDLLIPYAEYATSRFMRLMGVFAHRVSLVNYEGKIWAKCDALSGMETFASMKERYLDIPQFERGFISDYILCNPIVTEFVSSVLCLDSITGNCNRNYESMGIVDGDLVCINNDSSLHYTAGNTVECFVSNVISTQRCKNNDIRKLEISLPSCVDKLRRRFEYPIIFDAVEGLPIRVQRYFAYQLYIRCEHILFGKDKREIFEGLSALPYDYPRNKEDLCVNVL